MKLTRSAFMPKKSLVITILNTPSHCICIYIYFLQWSTRSLLNSSISSFIPTVQAAHLQKVVISIHGFSDTLSAVCAVYILYTIVMCQCWLIKEGRREGRKGGSQYNESAKVLLHVPSYASFKEELTFQNGAQTLPGVRKNKIQWNL